MKRIEKAIIEIEKMIVEASKKADYCAGVDYDCGFYVGKGEGLEDVLKLLKTEFKVEQ